MLHVFRLRLLRQDSLVACILLIEDEAQVRELLKEILAQNGHEIMECHNGSEGIRAFKQSTFDLVILDMLLPDKDGCETLRELKQPQGQENILAISGRFASGSDESITEIVRGLRVRDALATPFHLTDFLAVVNQCLISAPLSL